MAAVGDYILTVTSAAILYSILRLLIGKKTGTAIVLQLIGGLFLTFTVISPVADIDFGSLIDAQWDYAAQGNMITAEGKQMAQENMHKIIKQQCEAYILDKAMSYQTPIHVEVTLSDEDTPVPTAVLLEGRITPYTKKLMQNWIQDEMGILKENQIWTD